MGQEEQYANLNIEELQEERHRLEDLLECIDNWIEIKEETLNA